MDHRMRIAGYIFAVVIGACACLGQSQSGAQSGNVQKDSGDIAVVVNPVNPDNDVTLAHLRRLLLGDRRFWAGNVRVKLALRERGAHERDRLLTVLLDMDNRAFDEHWRAKVFPRGAAEKPLSLTFRRMGNEYLRGTAGCRSCRAGKTR